MRRSRRNVELVILAGVLLLVAPATGRSDNLPQKGGVLPGFELPVPAIEADRAYLGVEGATFKLQNVKCRVLLVEIIGVYCPRCYAQAPLFNGLFSRLQDGKLKDKVKMLGIAAGGTPMEVEYLRKEGQYRYPVVPDEKYAVHKLLGEPGTPFTLIVNTEGKVLFTHLGVIEDGDTFYETLKGLAE